MPLEQVDGKLRVVFSQPQKEFLLVHDDDMARNIAMGIREATHLARCRLDATLIF